MPTSNCKLSIPHGTIPCNSSRSKQQNQPSRCVSKAFFRDDELAHSFGFEDLDPVEYPTDLMTSQLDVGVRRLPDRGTLHIQDSRLINRVERFISSTTDDRGSSSLDSTTLNRLMDWLEDSRSLLDDSPQYLRIERGEIDRFFSSRKLLDSLLSGE